MSQRDKTYRDYLSAVNADYYTPEEKKQLEEELEPAIERYKNIDNLGNTLAKDVRLTASGNAFIENYKGHRYCAKMKATNPKSKPVNPYKIVRLWKDGNETSLKDIDHETRAVLAKAFSNYLVENDPYIKTSTLD